MKAKRRKTADSSAKKNDKGNILERQELVVQRLELSIEEIKAACQKHFAPSLERKGLSCDVLTGEQWPSCPSVKHIPDLKVTHVRFIKSSNTPDSRPSSSRQQCIFCIALYPSSLPGPSISLVIASCSSSTANRCPCILYIEI